VLMFPVYGGGEYCRNDCNINTVRIKYIFCALLVEIKKPRKRLIKKKKLNYSTSDTDKIP
jgi:hypothetical protein